MSDLSNFGGGSNVPESEKYTALMVTHLRNTRPWVQYLAILQIVMSAIMLLAGITTIGSGACAGSMRGAYSVPGFSGLGGMFVVSGLLYIGLSIIYIPMIVYQFRYVASIKNLLAAGRTADLENALGHQLAYWKYAGILSIVMLCIGVIAVIVLVAVTVSTGMRGLPGLG